MEKIANLPKAVKIAGIIVLLVILSAVYLFLMRLEPRDFVRMPDGVLDDAIYAAQQKDLKAFKRTFTNDMQERIQKMHDSNMNRELGTTSNTENAELFWTWDTLMKRMAKQGGFEVKPTSTKFLDYMIDGVAKVEIVYVDKEQNQQRSKNYTLYRNYGVWRIDLKADPDFVKAYRQSVKNLDAADLSLDR